MDAGMGPLLEYFSERGCLVEPDLASWLAKRSDAATLAQRALENMGEVPFLLTLPAFREALGGEAGSVAAAARGEDAAVARLLETRQAPDGVARVTAPGAMPTPTAFRVAEAAPPASPTTPPSPPPSGPRPGPAALPGALPALSPPRPSGAPDEEEAEESDDGDDDGAGGRVRPEDLLGPITFVPRSDWRPLAREHAAEVKVLKDVTGQSACDGSTADFVKYFQARHEALTRLLRQRREVAAAMPCRSVLERKPKEFAVVGLVHEKWTTPNGHLFLELEDDSGTLRVLVPHSEPEALGAAQRLVPDAVVGLVGQLSRKGDLAIAKQVVFPDIPLDKPRRTVDVPLSAAFVGDMHVGSRKFLADHWRHALRWLHGEEGNSRQRDAASRVKYLVLMGDVVDGIGVYPDQDKDLNIPDIFEQYEALAKLLEPVPEHVEVIFMPGNHDAVRPAEPQPAIDTELQKLFARNAVTFVANPSMFSLHGVEVLTYHGSSLVDYAKSAPGYTLFDPLPIMRELLRARHIAPVYGGDTPLAPEHTDYMVIDRVPDVFATGHVHACASGEYRGVQMLNASTWQAQTAYQASQNFVPKPARLPLVDLKTMRQTTVDFSQGL